MKRARSGVLACLAAWMTISPANAEEAGHPPVSLDLGGCPDVNAPEVTRIVGVELGALLVAEPSRDTTRVAIACDGKLASLHVDDPITKKSLDRTVDLSSFPANAQPRFVALAVAELVSASWTELESNPEPSVPPVGPPPSATVTQAARAIARARDASTPVASRSSPAARARIAVTASFSTRGYLVHTPALFGGAISVAEDFSLFDWRLELAALTGEKAFPLGSVRATTVDGAFALGLHARTGVFVLGGGVGVRGGVATLAGTANEPSVQAGTVRAPWFGPLALGRAMVTPLGPLAIELRLETGYAAVPVGGFVAGERAVAVDGAWIAGTLGAGVAF